MENRPLNTPGFTDRMTRGELIAAAIYLPVHVVGIPFGISWLAEALPWLYTLSNTQLNVICYGLGLAFVLIGLRGWLRRSFDAALDAEVKPTLIKPNLTEINGLLGTSFTPDDLPALKAALEADTRFASIPWVVVTMGGAGAVAFHEGRGYRVIMPNIPAVNATGSGDSTIAGFAHAIARNADDDTVLRCGNACGKLNAMDPQTGHLVIDRWDEVYNAIQVNEL